MGDILESHQYEAKVERVESPTALRLRIDLGLGVTSSRSVQIGCDTPATPQSYDNAMRCLVVLCASKTVLVTLDTTPHATERLLAKQILVPARNPAPEARVDTANRTWMDLAQYLRLLRDANYDIRLVWLHLNGSVRCIAG